jgi:hypothetical protein
MNESSGRVWRTEVKKMEQRSIGVINTLGSRLQALTGGIDFEVDDGAVDSPDQLVSMCAYNAQQLRKIELLDEEHQQRIRDLIPSILAVVLQEEAILNYGNTDDASVRGVLRSWYDRPEYQAFLEKLRQTTKVSLQNFNLTQEQNDAVMKDIFDQLPQSMMEVIEEMVAPVRLLPQVEAHSIGMTLADMMREATVCQP